MTFSRAIEQRKEERRPAPGVGLVDVFLERSRHRMRVGPSLLEDLSVRGVSIRMDERVDIGTVLYLSNRYVRYIGRVRNCRCLCGGFRIGMEFISLEKPASLDAQSKCLAVIAR
jgi:hypothetical protein